MNKSELITAVTAQTSLDRKNAEVAVNAVFQAMTDALTREEKIQIFGFGTFEVKVRKERTVINPRNKEAMLIPETKTPTFKAGKPLKDSVAQGEGSTGT